MEKKTVLTFTQGEIDELEIILLDKDGKAALDFLKNSLQKKIRSQKHSCNPDFMIYRKKGK